MRLRSRTTLALAGAVLAIGAGAGGALAAGGGGGEPETATAAPNGGGPGIALAVDRTGPGGPPAAIADYLGLTEDQLRAQLESGKTLAQIASAQGKPVSGLEKVIYTDAKSNLDQAVANGKLPADEEQTMLAELKSNLDEIVDGTGPRVIAKGVSAGPFGDAVASYLGLTPAELRAQVGNGETLAQVAGDQGKSVDGLKAAILAGAKTDLDAAVAAGKITAAQEQKMRADLESNIDELVNSAGPVQKTVAA
jgi:hypothetical protein